MKNIAVIAIIAGILALAGMAFAHGPGFGGWGGHMMAPGYHMNGGWGGHMWSAWGPGTSEEDISQNRGGYGPGNAWCNANPEFMHGWYGTGTPETSLDIAE